VFLVDDIFLFPIRSIFWSLREVCAAAEQEVMSERDAINSELAELYMMLETGRITEAEFEAREDELLGRLEEIQEVGNRIEEQ